MTQVGREVHTDGKVGWTLRPSKLGLDQGGFPVEWTCLRVGQFLLLRSVLVVWIA